MKIIYFVLGLVLLTTCYLLEGGHLSPLIQPVPLVTLLFGTPLFLSAKYGFNATMKGLVGGAGAPEGFADDALQITASIGGMLVVGGVMISLGKLDQGKEIVGHSVGASLVSLLYAFALSFYLMTLKQGASAANGGALGKFVPAVAATLTSMGLMMMVMWLISG